MMMTIELKWILEAILMSSPVSLSLEALKAAFTVEEQPTNLAMKKALDELAIDYESRAISLIYTANGYCFRTKNAFAPWIARLLTEKPLKYSNAFLEVLAIIAYKQPITRADIEAIRGVAVSSQMLKTLLEREWIHVAGHRDVPGKPAVYVTTPNFLDYFNLETLDDLPLLEEK